MLKPKCLPLCYSVRSPSHLFHCLSLPLRMGAPGRGDCAELTGRLTSLDVQNLCRPQ